MYHKFKIWEKLLTSPHYSAAVRLVNFVPLNSESDPANSVP